MIIVTTSMAYRVDGRCVGRCRALILCLSLVLRPRQSIPGVYLISAGCVRESREETDLPDSSLLRGIPF